MAEGAVALVVSTFMIVIFGEIIPQALCSRYGLVIGASMQWFMWLGIALTFPLSYPISAILDKILGAEVGLVMSKGMMKKFF